MRPPTYATLSQGFSSRSQSIGCSLASNPKPESEIRRAPFLLVAATYHLARTQQRRSTLKLLQSQQPQRVTHQHCYAVLTRSSIDRWLQSPQGQRVSR